MRYIALALLAALPAAAQISVKAAPPVQPPAVNGAKPSRVALNTFNLLEKRFDMLLLVIGGGTDSVDLYGGTRGIYLDGYGTVFTTQLSLIQTPTVNPFRPAITPQLAAQVHQRKLERLPLVKNTMREFLRNAASTLTQVPDNEQIVLAVRLGYLPWENTAGLPGQIVMKADRKSALAGVIKEEEQ